MTTILTEKNKSEIRREYYLKFLKTFIWMFFLICLVFIIFQATIYYSIQIEKEGLVRVYNSSNEQKRNLLIDEYRKELKKANDFLVNFDSQKQSVVEVIDFIYQNKTETIFINSVSIDNKEDGTFVVVTGSSIKREDLLSFSKSLEKSENITDFNLPLSSFTKNKEIPFSLTFKYKKI